jgi:hypothetical protein
MVLSATYPRSRARDLASHSRDPVAGRRLGDALDPQHGERRAAGELPELVPADAHVRSGEALVDHQQLGARGPQHGRGVFAGVGSQAALVDGALGRVAVEVLREHADRALVGDRGGHVRPLAPVRALGEQAAELVERLRRRAQDPVRVVVDVPDAAQYFSKCPCCSNAAPPAEYAAHSERRTAR